MQSGTRRNSGWIAIVVRRIGLPTCGRHLRTPGRLGILPNLGERHSALCGSRKWIGEHAPRCWAATIIADEEMNIPPCGVIANIVGGHHRYLIRFAKGDSRAVDARAIAALDNAVCPGVNIAALLGKHAASLLLVKKNDRALGEPLCGGGPDCRCRIARTDGSSVA